MTRTTLALTLLAALGSAAHAGRPLQAEDAGILERGTCEVEGASQRLTEPGAPRATGTSLQLACGVGGSSQVALALLNARAAGVTAQGLRLGGKSEVWHAVDKDGAAFTIAWALTGEKSAGQSLKHAATDLNAVLSVPVDGATLHLNLGHSRDEQAKQRGTTWAIAYEHDSFGAWAPMAEAFGDDRDAPWWNLGLRFTAVPEKVFFDLSYGRQMATGRPTLVTAGFKFTF